MELVMPSTHNEDRYERITEELSRLSSLLVQTITENRLDREAANKLLKAHSEEIWGTGDGDIGIKAKMRDLTEERKREREMRLWWRAAIGIPLAAMLVDWIIRVIHNLKSQ
jgi:hypothetical protein